MKLSATYTSAALLLIGCVSPASAQSYWYNQPNYYVVRDANRATI
jgi:PBP1b-binding outer membrane lipoprotein LpoB